jgi:hypothetical protein
VISVGDEEMGIKNPSNLFDDYDEHGGDPDRDEELDEEDLPMGFHIHNEEAVIDEDEEDGPAQFVAEESFVPTMDDDEAAVERIGPLAYYVEDTFVISGPTNPRGGVGRMMGVPMAAEWCEITYGKPIENLSDRTPNRWAFRVVKPGSPGGRYTPPPPSWFAQARGEGTPDDEAAN